MNITRVTGWTRQAVEQNWKERPTLVEILILMRPESPDP